MLKAPRQEFPLNYTHARKLAPREVRAQLEVYAREGLVDGFRDGLHGPMPEQMSMMGQVVLLSWCRP